MTDEYWIRGSAENRQASREDRWRTTEYQQYIPSYTKPRVHETHVSNSRYPYTDEKYTRAGMSSSTLKRPRSPAPTRITSNKSTKLNTNGSPLSPESQHSSIDDILSRRSDSSADTSTTRTNPSSISDITTPTSRLPNGASGNAAGLAESTSAHVATFVTALGKHASAHVKLCQAQNSFDQATQDAANIKGQMAVFPAIRDRCNKVKDNCRKVHEKSKAESETSDKQIAAALSAMLSAFISQGSSAQAPASSTTVEQLRAQTSRITQLEEKFAKQEEDHARQLSDLKRELATIIYDQDKEHKSVTATLRTENTRQGEIITNLRSEVSSLSQKVNEQSALATAHEVDDLRKDVQEGAKRHKDMTLVVNNLHSKLEKTIDADPVSKEAEGRKDIDTLIKDHRAQIDERLSTFESQLKHLQPASTPPPETPVIQAMIAEQIKQHYAQIVTKFTAFQTFIQSQWQERESQWHQVELHLRQLEAEFAETRHDPTKLADFTRKLREFEQRMDVFARAQNSLRIATQSLDRSSESAAPAQRTNSPTVMAPSTQQMPPNAPQRPANILPGNDPRMNANRNAARSIPQTFHPVQQNMQQNMPQNMQQGRQPYIVSRVQHGGNVPSGLGSPTGAHTPVQAFQMTPEERNAIILDSANRVLHNLNGQDGAVAAIQQSLRSSEDAMRTANETRELCNNFVTNEQLQQQLQRQPVPTGQVDEAKLVQTCLDKVNPRIDFLSEHSIKLMTTAQRDTTKDLLKLESRLDALEHSGIPSRASSASVTSLEACRMEIEALKSAGADMAGRIASIEQECSKARESSDEAIAGIKTELADVKSSSNSAVGTAGKPGLAIEALASVQIDVAGLKKFKRDMNDFAVHEGKRIGMLQEAIGDLERRAGAPSTVWQDDV